jgi:hypothetical protein
MKKKILNWLLKIAFKITDKTSVHVLLNEYLVKILKHAFYITDDQRLLEREIQALIFDAKYQGEDLLVKPHVILNGYYDKAAKGDNSFMSDSFYRALRVAGDPEIRKLKYRLKRNQS